MKNHQKYLTPFKLLTQIIIEIFSNEAEKEKCLAILEENTIRAEFNKNIYKKYCDQPWKIIVWYWLSLNSKGGSKNAKDWHENINNVLELINPDSLRKSFNNNEEILIAINIILRHYAGGRFLTLSNKKLLNAYLLDETLNLEVLKNKVYQAKLVSKDHKKVDSYKLFKLFKDCDFNTEIINSKYPKICLIKDEIESLKINGIGDKYARNVRMDMRTNDSENFIAIDLRIINILEKVGLKKIRINNKIYKEIENAFNNIILKNKKIIELDINYSSRPNYNDSMTSWELDRILYNIAEEKFFKTHLTKTSKMNKNFDEWLIGKDFNKNVEEILRTIDSVLSLVANDTRRGKGRISFGNPGVSAVILFPKPDCVKLQIKMELFEDKTPNYKKFGFHEPTIKQHAEKGFMELKITYKSQFKKELENYLKGNLINS